MTPVLQRQPGGYGRRTSVGQAVKAALGVAVIGSAALALVEVAAGVWVGAEHFPMGWWPTDLIVFAYGKVALTHVIVWTPLLLVCALILGFCGIPRSSAPADPALWSLLVLLAGCVVFPADLHLGGWRSSALLVGVRVGACLAAVVTYWVLWRLARRVGVARFRRITKVTALLAGLVIALAALAFARSPLLSQGDYLVPRGSNAQGACSAPNVLWVVVDTLRADHTSCHGYSRQTTPFLESWAEKSLVFDRAVSNGIWTVPAHASMFTGLSRREHGADVDQEWLDDSLPTLAEELTARGYATALFSNNPWVAPKTNLSRGFDTCVIVCHLRRLGRFSLEHLGDVWGITPILPWLDGDYGAAITNRMIADWLDTRRDRGAPFFLLVNYMEAHLPYRVPKRYRAMYLDEQQLDRSYDLRKGTGREITSLLHFDFNIEGDDFLAPGDHDILARQYDAAIRYLDDRLRELISICEQRGLLDNTLVVITSDHGEYLNTHGMWGHTFLAYEDLLHVPLMIRPPNSRQGLRLATPVLLSDLHPTVLNAIGGRLESGAGSGARDLIALAADPPVSRLVISEYGGSPQRLMPRIRKCAAPEVLHRAQPQIAVQDGRCKYISSDDGTRELYDLREDPGELRNLIGERADEAERLEAYINAWLEATPAHTFPRRVDESPSREVLESLRSLGYVGDDD